MVSEKEHSLDRMPTLCEVISAIFSWHCNNIQCSTCQCSNKMKCQNLICQ